MHYFKTITRLGPSVNGGMGSLLWYHLTLVVYLFSLTGIWRRGSHLHFFHQWIVPEILLEQRNKEKLGVERVLNPHSVSGLSHTSSH